MCIVVVVVVVVVVVDDDDEDDFTQRQIKQKVRMNVKKKGSGRCPDIQ